MLRLSVLVPVRNARPWLDASLASLWRQTIRDFEVVAVDDAGTVIHPILAEGQVEGGTLQAVGYATIEEMKVADGRYVNDRVAEGMASRGWVPGMLKTPPGLHLMMSLLHKDARPDYLRDLAASAAEVRTSSGKSKLEATYS